MKWLVRWVVYTALGCAIAFTLAQHVFDTYGVKRPEVEPAPVFSRPSKVMYA